MPTISRFHGIVIYMNYNDHDPPHFHARRGDEEVLVELASGVVRGAMSRRALQMVFQWMDAHRDELAANWDRARQHVALLPIRPLD